MSSSEHGVFRSSTTPFLPPYLSAHLLIKLQLGVPSSLKDFLSTGIPSEVVPAFDMESDVEKVGGVLVGRDECTFTLVRFFTSSAWVCDSFKRAVLIPYYLKRGAVMSPCSKIGEVLGEAFINVPTTSEVIAVLVRIEQYVCCNGHVCSPSITGKGIIRALIRFVSF